MKDSIREINEIPELTMGLDLGDKFSYYCTQEFHILRMKRGQ